MILTFARPNVRALVGAANIAVFGFAISGNAPVSIVPAGTGFSHDNYIAVSPNQMAVRFGYKSVGASSIPVDHRTITDTDYVQRPVDYYMPNLPQYDKIESQYEAGGGKITTKVRASGGSVRLLDGGAPSFTTTTNSKGYD